MIHPTAQIGRDVVLAPDVQVGPFTVIEGAVEIGSGSRIGSHSVISGNCRIGSGCKIGPAAYVGGPPQHLGFDPATATWTIVGNNSIIREGATVNRATKPGIENATRMGDDCFLMAAAHIGHDCQVGDGVIFANDAKLGGNVTIGDRAFIGGGAGVHQNCRIGRLAIIAANELLTHDVPAFAAARYGRLKGYNAIGCRRAGLSQDAIFAIRAVYRCLKKHRTRPLALEAIAALEIDLPEVSEIVDFILSTKRGILRSDASVDHSRAEMA